MKFLMNLENIFSPKDYPFLTRQVSEFSQLSPISVTNNTPLMATAIIKLKPFIANHIQLFVAADAEMHDKRVLLYLKEKNIFCRFNKSECAQGDVFLDCGADLMNFGHPKTIAELTQTGSEKYKKAKKQIPVVSIDESKVKLLEDFYGTADGFVRAIKEKINPILRDKHFIIWGYGKVGKGIAHFLNFEKAKITAVDVNKNTDFAKRQNVQVLHPVNDAKEIQQMVQHAYCLVTCTGRKGLISQLPYYPSILNSNLILANMGAEDEFGEKFPKNRILNNKLAANFLLEFPTRIKYLDPVFYAHNSVVKLFHDGKLSKGFSKYPDEYSNAILQEWCDYWHEDISDIDLL